MFFLTYSVLKSQEKMPFWNFYCKKSHSYSEVDNTSDGPSLYSNTILKSEVYLCSGSLQQNENDMTTNQTIIMKDCLQLILCLCNPHFLLILICDLTTDHNGFILVFGIWNNSLHWRDMGWSPCHFLEWCIKTFILGAIKEFARQVLENHNQKKVILCKMLGFRQFF
jgi:hypothetical protein